LRLRRATRSAIDSFGTGLAVGIWRRCARTWAAINSSISLGGLRMGVGFGWMLCFVGDLTINRAGGSLSVGGVVSKLYLGTCCVSLTCSTLGSFTFSAGLIACLLVGCIIFLILSRASKCASSLECWSPWMACRNLLYALTMASAAVIVG
jgi:hypothetical protein